MIAYNRALRKGAGVVELDGLENRCAGNRTEGSNPSPSARAAIRYPQTTNRDSENYYIQVLLLFATIGAEGGEMGKTTSVPRYYIRDDETNEIWCFNAKTYGGTKQSTTA